MVIGDSFLKGTEGPVWKSAAYLGPGSRMLPGNFLTLLAEHGTFAVYLGEN